MASEDISDANLAPSGTDELRAAIDDLAVLATEFCSVIESSSLSPDDLIDRLDEFLPLLYHRGGRLNSLAPSDLFEGDEDLFQAEGEGVASSRTELFETTAEPADDTPATLSKLRELLDWRDRYYVAVVESDVEGDYDVEERYLSESLHLMYQTLAPQMNLHRAQKIGSAGSVELRNLTRDLLSGFLSVWGPTIPHMLIAVFDLLYGELEEDELEEEL